MYHLYHFLNIKLSRIIPLEIFEIPKIIFILKYLSLFGISRLFADKTLKLFLLYWWLAQIAFMEGNCSVGATGLIFRPIAGRSCQALTCSYLGLNWGQMLQKWGDDLYGARLFLFHDSFCLRNSFEYTVQSSVAESHLLLFIMRIRIRIQDPKNVKVKTKEEKFHQKNFN